MLISFSRYWPLNFDDFPSGAEPAFSTFKRVGYGGRIWILNLLIYLYIYISRWWFQALFIFIPMWGRFPFWLLFFQMGWNHQPVFTIYKYIYTCTYYMCCGNRCFCSLSTPNHPFWLNKYLVAPVLLVDLLLPNHATKWSRQLKDWWKVGRFFQLPPNLPTAAATHRRLSHAFQKLGNV